jgi:tRNA(Ile)-lysidine synthase
LEGGAPLARRGEKHDNGRVNEFLQRVAAGVKQRRLLPRGQKILVAVSGGADSMVLLHALHSLAQKNRWKIFVAHFNHRLRGRASDADEKLVRQTVKKMALPFFCERADVAGFACRAKISVEMAARKLRHEFLARTARRQKISVVALAHHADDQVELFFLRLLRGAGGEGLAGMKWCSPSPADKRVFLIRPLLDFTKDGLLAFARETKIQFREDKSNASSDFLRNRVRNELLPLLQKKYQPGLTKTVLRLMEIIGAETKLAGEMARCWERRHPAGVNSRRASRPAGRMPTLPETAFAQLPVAVQRRVLQQRLTALGLMASFDLVERLRAQPDKSVSVGFGLEVACSIDGHLDLRKPRDERFKPDELQLKLSGRVGWAEFGGRNFRWHFKLQKTFRRPAKTTGIECFDADRVGGEIILRHWRAGDRFQPIGLKSAAKLQDLFVNAKIPAARRRTLVLAATAAGEIFWVEGLRIGERFKLVASTRRVLVWNCPKFAV